MNAQHPTSVSTTPTEETNSKAPVSSAAPVVLATRDPQPRNPSTGERQEQTARHGQEPATSPAPMPPQPFVIPQTQATTTPTAPTNAPAPHAAVPVENASLVSPLKSVHLAVDPPELGRVDLRITVSDQRVYASVATERSDVGQYLMNHQPQLQAGLQAYGLDLSGFRVDVDARGPGHHGWSFGSNADPSASREGQQAPQDHLGPQLSAFWREPSALSVFA
jgi:flagellar hook-length control protein FliK